jgi:hypothetical protein
MFFRKAAKPAVTPYDPAEKKPVIRCSICTGEQVAGFRRADGSFEEVLLLRDPADLQFFRDRYGITGDIEKIY